MSTYKILALGDSIIWGQGLKAGDKFVNIVAQTIKGETNVEDVEVCFLAHSGAEIGTKPKYNTYLHGEVPRSNPNIYTQVALAKGRESEDGLRKGGDAKGARVFDGLPSSGNPARPYEIAEQVAHKKHLRTVFAKGNYAPNLIIVDGGINSPLFGSLFGPAFQGDNLEDWFGQLTTFFSNDAFVELVDGVAVEFQTFLEDLLHTQFPKARVILTGYFPIFTQGSKIGGQGDLAVFLLTMIPGMGETFAKILRLIPVSWWLQVALTSVKGNYKNVLIYRSALWYATWQQQMETVVRSLSVKHPNRIFFVNPEFGDENGVFAKEPYLFVWQDTRKISSEEDLLALRPADPLKATREKAYRAAIAGGYITFEKPLDEAPLQELEFRLASVGHPNVAGAREYATRILGLIRREEAAFGLKFITQTWAKSTRLNKQSPEGPALAVLNGKLFMAWKSNDKDNDLFVASSSDGMSWTGSTRLKKQSPRGPALAVFNGKLFMAWKSNDKDNDLFVASSKDGVSWSDSMRLDKQSPESPALAVLDGRLVMAWKSNDEDNDLFVATSNNGFFWTDSKRLSKQSPKDPALATMNGVLYMAWKSNGKDNDLFVASSKDGVTWTDSKRLTKQSPEGPALAMFNDRLFMAWKSNDEDNDLFVASSNDGLTWTDSTRLEKQSPKDPSLAPLGEKLHMAWVANDDSNDIFVASMQES